MELFDTHCHLDDHAPEELQRIVSEAHAAGVTRILAVGASRGVTSAKHALDVAGRFANVWASAGVHPHDAKDYTRLDEIAQLAAQNKVLAIGETGLDFFKDWSPIDKQEELFRNSIRLARSLKKPLIIHCREAEKRTLEILTEEQGAEVGGVFHCFGGTSQWAAEIRKLNFLVSFTGTVTFKSAHSLRDTVRELPPRGFLLETDAPYMAPEPLRGKPSESKHVRIIAEKVAEVRGVSVEQIADETTSTALKLFQLT